MHPVETFQLCATGCKQQPIKTNAFAPDPIEGLELWPSFHVDNTAVSDVETIIKVDSRDITQTGAV